MRRIVLWDRVSAITRLAALRACGCGRGGYWDARYPPGARLSSIFCCYHHFYVISITHEWINTLVLSLPTHNSTVRMRVWRALKDSGCGVLRDGVYVLPAGRAQTARLAKIGDRRSGAPAGSR